MVLICHISIVIALLVAERLWGNRNTDWLRNLQTFGIYTVVTFTLLPLLPEWTGPALIAGSELPFWQGFILFLLVKDFAEYAFHRAQHRIPLLWAMHSLHHSDPELGVLTTGRHFWGDQLLKAVTIWPASLMIVSPTPEILLAYLLVGFTNYFAHCNVPIDFGRWSWVINNPAYHRRHHSKFREHHDSNFAALLPIFDVIFGTYVRPDGFPPTGLSAKPGRVSDVIIWPLIWFSREETNDPKSG